MARRADWLPTRRADQLNMAPAWVEAQHHKLKQCQQLEDKQRELDRK